MDCCTSNFHLVMMQLNLVQSLSRTLLGLRGQLITVFCLHRCHYQSPHTIRLGRDRYTDYLFALETCRQEEVTSVTGVDIVTPLKHVKQAR